MDPYRLPQPSARRGLPPDWARRIRWTWAGMLAILGLALCIAAYRNPEGWVGVILGPIALFGALVFAVGPHRRIGPAAPLREGADDVVVGAPLALDDGEDVEDE